MKIILIRHGDRDQNFDALTLKGKKEANILGNYLKDFEIDGLYCSCLKRAIDTVNPIIKYHRTDLKNKLIVKDWLKEFDYEVNLENEQGRNITWDIYPDYYSSLKGFYDFDDFFELPFIKEKKIKEKYDEVVNNFDEVLKEYGYTRKGLLYKAILPNEKTIVFVCHFGVMCVLMSHLMNIGYQVLANTSICVPTGVTTFISEERKKGIAIFRLNGFSDISHLRMKKIEPSSHGRFCEMYESKARH